MKIKTVMEITGLTDRAIRLYIDNGLVAPDISENHAGRKNIEFSDRDVSLLNNIALLRKAGFSISDIKTLLTDKTQARSVVDSFIESADKEIENKAEIVARLKSIDAEKTINADTVCQALSASVSSVKMPDEDMMHSARDESDRKFAVVISAVFMVLPFFVYAGINIINKLQFRYSHFTGNDYLWSFILCFGWFLIFVMGVVSFLLCRKKYSFSKGRKRRKTASEILILFCVALVVPSILPSIFAVGFPTVYSQTTDIADYLILDNSVEEAYGKDIRRIFPDKIPDSASKRNSDKMGGYPYSTRYYYMYESTFDHSFDLFAEWTLPENEFLKAVDDVPDDFVHSEYKGAWNCLYYIDTEQDFEESGTYYWFLIFAYNEQTQSVRYIASYAIDSQNGPYYMTVEW